MAKRQPLANVLFQQDRDSVIYVHQECRALRRRLVHRNHFPVLRRYKWRLWTLCRLIPFSPLIAEFLQIHWADILAEREIHQAQVRFLVERERSGWHCPSKKERLHVGHETI